MKLEIRNLQTQIECLKKQNIDLKCKAKIAKLPESAKTSRTLKNEIKAFKNTTQLLKALTYNSKSRTVTLSETPLRELKII